MITVTGPDGSTHSFPDGTNPNVIRNAMARHYAGPVSGGHGVSQDFAPAASQPSHAQVPTWNQAFPGHAGTATAQNGTVVPVVLPPSGQHPQHPQSQDLWRSAASGAVQGVNSAGSPIGGMDDLTDRLAEMAAKGEHDLGQTFGLVPKDQPYQPGSGSQWTQALRSPGTILGAAAHGLGLPDQPAHDLAAGINAATQAADPTITALHQFHPSTWHDAEVSAAQSAAGGAGAAAVRDVADYQPQTPGGRFVQRGASMLPGAFLPGSTAQRAIAVAAPTLGATIGGEGARAMGAAPETVSDAELLAGLLGAGVGGASVKPIEGALTNAGDAIAGPRAVPTSGDVSDLWTMLRGGAGRPSGENAPSFKQSDLRGAANILAQHVARVGRANGENFGAMGSRVGATGWQGMLADALPDLGRNVADRGSYGQQFLGNQLNERQLGVLNPETGSYSEPSAAMRLDGARRSALGVQDGAFNTTDALTQAQQANAGPLYTEAHAQPPVSGAEFAPFAESPLWQDAYNRARGLSQVQMVDLPGGGKGIQALPDQMPDALDWRTLDLMKQGISDKISENAQQGIGAHEQGALKGYLGLLTEQQNTLNPTLGDARAAFSGPASVKDAIGFGRDAYSMDPAELAAELRGMSSGEQQGANVGFYQAGRDATMGRSQRLNAAEALGATNPDMMARNRALMGGNFGDWNTTLGNEATFNATRQRVLGGSLTSRNLLGSEDSAAAEGVNPFEAAAGLVRAAHGDLDGAVETAGTFGKLAGIAKLFQPQPSQMTEGSADVLGTILGTRGAFLTPQTAALIQGLMDSAGGPASNYGVVKPAALLSAPQQPQDQGGPSAP